jgi:hypothetical protein
MRKMGTLCQPLSSAIFAAKSAPFDMPSRGTLSIPRWPPRRANKGQRRTGVRFDVSCEAEYL